jgi:hypothetical protein
MYVTRNPRALEASVTAAGQKRIDVHDCRGKLCLDADPAHVSSLHKMATETHMPILCSTVSVFFHPFLAVESLLTIRAVTVTSLVSWLITCAISDRAAGVWQEPGIPACSS